jgi:hypothetical protein
MTLICLAGLFTVNKVWQARGLAGKLRLLTYSTDLFHGL